MALSSFCSLAWRVNVNYFLDGSNERIESCDDLRLWRLFPLVITMLITCCRRYDSSRSSGYLLTYCMLKLCLSPVLLGEKCNNLEKSRIENLAALSLLVDFVTQYTRFFEIESKCLSVSTEWETRDILCKVECPLFESEKLDAPKTNFQTYELFAANAVALCLTLSGY